MLVSPALRDLLDSPEGALLEERLPYEVAGTLGKDGLIGPADLRYVAHVDFLDTDNLDGRGERFGWSVPEEPKNAFLILLVVVACVVLLLPVLVFVATAVRFGGEQRDRRLAALRLVGADAPMTRRIAAGESLAGALLGLLTGAGLFAAARQFAGAFTLWDVNAFPSDVTPLPALAALALVTVPVASVAVTLVALRGVAIEPLGVVRDSAPRRRRRLWWRLLLLAAGAALLAPLMGRVSVTETSIDTVPVVTGTVLFLIGLTTLLPWLVEAGVKRLHAGPVAWQLAVRRLQLSSGTAARAVSGIVVAATGAIALQMLFQAMENEFALPTGADSSRAQVVVGFRGRTADEARDITARFARTEGVDEAMAVVESHVWRPGPPEEGEESAPSASLRVGDCSSLREYAVLPSCEDGDVFVLLAHGAQGSPDDARTTAVARPGATVALRDPHPPEDGPERPADGPRWRIPAGAKVVDSRPDPTGMYQYGVLATPSALDTGLLAEPYAQNMVRTDPAVPDAADRVRNTAAAIDPTAWVKDLKETERDAAFSSVRTGILVGSTLTMLLVAASLLVTTLEQLRDRKRLLSSLVAFGTRRSTLALSVLWQTAVPIALGLALAVAGGLGLGVVLLRMGGQPVQDWWVFLPVVGIGAALIALVTLLSMPALWRLMRADGLRTE
nr:FtsX-like permease family protein [Streptomyces sp. WAC08241]